MGVRDRLRLLILGGRGPVAILGGRGPVAILGGRGPAPAVVRGAPTVGRPAAAAPPKLAVADRPSGAVGWSGPGALDEVPKDATVVFADEFGRGNSAPPLLGPVAVTGTDPFWVAAVGERLSAMGHANVGFIVTSNGTSIVAPVTLPAIP